MPDPGYARARLIAARQAREDAEPEWRAAIVEALAAGMGAVEVARLAGCTRQRVHQIRHEQSNRLDRRRG